MFIGRSMAGLVRILVPAAILLATGTVARGGETSASAPAASIASRAEVRAAWFSSPDIRRTRKEITQKLQALKDANFNTTCFDFQMFGFVTYAGSAYLPQYGPMKATGDNLLFAVEEAHRLGLRAELVAGYGFMDFKTPSATTSTRGSYLTQHPDRAELDVNGIDRTKATDGKAYYVRMCPANPANHEFLGKLYAEAVARYPVDGIILCNFWYRGSDVCHCAYCQMTFKQAMGFDLKPFPPGSKADQLWADWKRQRLTDGLTTITQAIRTARPGVSVCVSALSATSMRRQCQPWTNWLKAKIIDGAALHLASKSAVGRYQQHVKDALRLPNAAPGKIYCAMTGEVPPESILQLVGHARKARTVGQLFQTAANLTPTTLYVLRDGPYSTPAMSPFGPPMPTQRDADVE